MARLTDSFSGIDVVPRSPHGLELYTTTGELENRITTVTGIAGIGNLNVVNDYLFDSTFIPSTTYVPGSYTTLFFNDTVVTQTTATYNITVPQGGAISATGQQDFTTVGTTPWVVPANVYSISAVVVGGGGGGSAWTSGGGGGRGGDLRYAISIPVTPGETLTITVGAGGVKALTAVAGSGGFSDISRSGTSLLQAAGGAGGSSSSGFGATLGTSTPTSANIGGGTGGTHAAGGTTNTSGGGGAAGYTGNGGNAGVGAVAGTAGAGGGGGGGGGGGSGGTGASGGGVGIYGLGANGAAGLSGAVGLGGSGGTDGNASTGGVYGGGGGGSDAATLANAKDGGQGAVRIIYGEGRTYPSTRTVDQELYAGLPLTTATTYTTSTLVASYEYVKYPANTFVKITDTVLAYTTVTQVTSAGTGYITISTPAGFPVVESGSMRIQNASLSVYSKSHAFNSFQQTQYEVTSVQDSLAAAETAPNIRGRKYFIDRAFSDTLPAVNSTTSKLSVFNDIKIPGDFRRQLTGQTPDAFNLIAKWFIDEQDIIGSVSNTTTTKTVYFSDIEALPFTTGSTVRIRNQQSGYLGEFVVTSSTNYSVTFDKPILFTDTSGAVIERAESSVYPQSYVSTTTAPTNARENLYYFNLGPGIRFTQPYKFTSKDQINVGTINRIFRPLNTTPPIVHGKVSAAAKLKAESTRLVPSSLVSPKLVVKSFNDKLAIEKLSTPKIIVKYIEPSIYKLDALEKAKLRNFAEIVSVSTLTNEVTNLSQFDNIENLIQGPIYNITGQASQSVNNAVLNYIFDEDVLVTSSTPITELTLYFYNSRETAFAPYPIGSYVTVFNTVGKYRAQVRNAGSNFVTLDLPYGYSNESYNTIASSTLDIIPAVDYKPVIIGTAPRDVYYFSQLSPSKGFIYNDTIHKFEEHRAILSSAVLSKPISKLTSLPGVLTTELLNKQLSKMIADRTTLTTDKLNVASVVRGEQSRIQATQLEKSIVTFKETFDKLSRSAYVNKFRVDQTHVFETPSVSKVAASIVVRSDTTLLKVAPVRSVTKLVKPNVDVAHSHLEKRIIRLDFDDTNAFTVTLLNPAKFKADMAQVFDLPVMFNLEKQIVNVRPDNNNISANTLQKPITAMRTDNTILSANTLKNMSPVLADRTVLKSNEYITRLKVNQTQMFETPLSSKLSAMARLVGNTNYHTVLKLTASAVVKNAVVLPRVFKETRFKVDRTQVFSIPNSGKLTASAVVRADRSIRELGKLKASTVIKAPTIPVQISAALQKRITNVVGLGSNINAQYQDQFYSQSLVYTNRPPVNARENLYYYQLAPGYRYNRTIEQGNAFALMTSTIESNRLESYDNVGLTDGPTYRILNQLNGQVGNTVLEYIFDLDILTTTTTPVTALTVFFDNTNGFIQPYPVGSYVSLTRNVDPQQTYVAQVIASTVNSVTTALPENWDKDWIWNTITSASSFVYPRTNVRTTVAPTNPREMLYYAEIAPGYKTNISNDQGLTIAGDAVNVRSGNIERDYYRLREAKDYLFLAGLLNTAGKLKGLYQEPLTISPGKVLPRSNIRGIPQNLLQSKFGQVERIKWGNNPDFGTRFAEVIRLESRGGIIRLKTGTFNKMHDVAIKKKDPIQFWN